MSELNTSNPLALQMLLNEDLYLVDKIEAINKSTGPAIPVVRKTPATTEQAASDLPVFDYLGENNRYMLLLVSSSSHKTMPPKELEALKSILQAKKMDLKDVAIVNLVHYPSVTFQQLKSYFACNSIVLFGVSPQQVKINELRLNKLSDFQGTKVLSTYSFAEMLNDTDKKREFWKEMKAL